MVTVRWFDMVRILLRTLFIGRWLLAAGAAAQTLALRDYTLANGLPQTRVYAMCQDGQGHLWAGTQGGVCVRRAKIPHPFHRSGPAR